MKTFKKFVESGKKITESTLRDERSIELGSTTGVLKFVPAESGIYLEMWAGGNGYDRVWKNTEFAEKLAQAQKTQDKALQAEVEKEYHALRDDILKVANNYDREIEKAMNKHGFRK